MLVVSPSPRELYAALTEDEKVAIDIFVRGDEDRDELHKLASPTRQRYLEGLAKQLVALGFSIGESADLDRQCADWEASRRRHAERMAARDKDREEARARRDRWLQSLTPEVRRSVERQDRRRRRRGGR